MTNVGQHSSNPERIAVYVDGYNVYYGLCSKGWRRYLWLDYRRLFENELRPHQELVAVNYFTALGRKQSNDSHARQHTYLEALDEVGGVNIRIAGKFETRPWKCRDCGRSTKRPQEKKTDVAIAVALIADVHADEFDTAWLMCADADLVPAVEFITNVFPQKTMVALPPRGRRSNELIDAIGRKRDISRSRHAQAQLPGEITKSDGEILRRPLDWS